MESYNSSIKTDRSMVILNCIRDCLSHFGIRIYALYVIMIFE